MDSAFAIDREQDIESPSDRAEARRRPSGVFEAAEPCSVSIAGELSPLTPLKRTVAVLAVLQGTASFNGTARLDAVRGTLVWVPAGTRLEPMRASRSWTAVVVTFSDAYLAMQLGNGCRVAADAPYRHVMVPPGDRRGILALLSDFAQQDADTVRLGAAYLLQRLWQVTTLATTSPASPSTNLIHPVVQRALNTLESDPRIGITQLASTVRASTSHLTRLFRTQLGMAPGRVREQMRIERFLRDYSLETSLLQSAFSCGFGSYAQFYRAFRRHTGMGPREYLRQKPARENQCNPQGQK